MKSCKNIQSEDSESLESALTFFLIPLQTTVDSVLLSHNYAGF